MGEWINECFRVAAKGLPRGCRVDPVLWWDEEIDAAIILRELLRSMADEEPGLHLAAFQDQVAAVNTLIRQKKTESWRNFTSTTLRYGLNPAQAAAIFKHMNREARASLYHALTSPTGRECFSSKDKAGSFVNMFAMVARNDHTTNLSAREAISSTEEGEALNRRK